MRNFIRSTILCAAFSAAAFGQCGSAGHLIFNVLSGQFDCTANSGIPPSGAAGGVLGGSYPTPTFAGGASFPADATLFLNGIGTFTAVSTANSHTTFSNVASVAITLTGVADHAVVACFDNSTPPQLIIPDHIQQTDANTVTAFFVPNATGYCNASTGVGATGATGPQGPAGPGGGATIPSTTDLIKGDGAGNGADSGIVPANVPLLNGTNAFTGGNGFSKNLTFSGTLSPTALAGDVNDYNPTGCATSLALRIDGGAADRNITGLQCAASAPVDGQIITITNIGATNVLVLKNQSASSSVANRFLLPADTTLPIDTALAFRYDGTSSRWRPWSRALANTGVTAGTYQGLTVDVAGRVTAGATRTINTTSPITGGGDLSADRTFALNVGVDHAFTAAQSITVPTSTTTVGGSLISSTAATSGNQKFSPFFLLEGNGWGTTGGTSQPVRFKTEVQPVQGTVPTGLYTIQASINGGAYTVPLTINSNGVITMLANSNLNTDGINSIGGTTVVSSTVFKVSGRFSGGGTAPTIASGFGSSPSIAGSNLAGRVTVGTGGSATSGVISFSSTYANAPVCTVNNETTQLAAFATTTTTQLTIASATAFGAADKLDFLCIGY